MSRNPRPRRFPRFDRLERAVHWCNATLFLLLMFTGATLYFEPLSRAIAHRHTVKTIHVYAGLLLPVPVLLALIVPAGRQFRRDVARFNRWTAEDKRWWSPSRRASAQLGKFNPGQKLNAVFVGAAIVLMLMSGSIMRWFQPFPDSIRTGATFVHDWTFIALLFVVTGHIMFALADFDSLRSMIRGWVPEQWARNEHPAWWAEIVTARAGEAASADAAGDVEAGAYERFDEAGARAREMPVGD
jgi:formate dehydrogenase subunit gamma